MSRLEQTLTMQGRREADELAGRAVGMSAHVEDEGLLQRRHHHCDQLEAAVRRLRSRSAEVSALHVDEDDSAEVPEVGGAAGRRRVEDLVHSVTKILHVRHAELVSCHGEEQAPARATRSSAAYAGQDRSGWRPAMGGGCSTGGGEVTARPRRLSGRERLPAAGRGLSVAGL